MFHLEDLVSNKDLAKVWKTAYDIDTEEEYNLPEICENLDSRINSESFEIHKRLSLRTSSTLVCGAAKLYRAGVCKLLEDVERLEKTMALSKRGHTEISSDSYASSEFAKSPEPIREQAKQNVETTVAPDKRIRTNNPGSLSEATPSYSNNHSSTKSATEDMGCSSKNDVRPDLHSTGCSVRPEPDLVDTENPTTSKNQRKDQGCQTSSITNKEKEKEGDNGSLDEDVVDKSLPYCCVLVYDKYRSRLPSKIILSSVTNDIRNLI